MKNKNHDDNSGVMGASWSLLLNTIYLSVILVILALGYLLLEDQINAIVNKKVYSKEEIALINRRATIQQSLENEEKNWDRISKGIHLRTGLHDDPNLKVVIASCTSCHSAKLITQNKATRAGWQTMIKWMQKTQGLPDLGSSEPIILDYLAKYYSPKETGRRKNLNVEEIKWFVLNVEK